MKKNDYRKQIEAEVERWVKEDQRVGMFVRKHYPEQFERILKEGRRESKAMRRELDKHIVVPSVRP